MKANVLKPRNFFLKSLELDFGVTLVKKRTRTLPIILENTSNKQRQFTISRGETSFEGCSIDALLETEPNQSLEIEPQKSAFDPISFSLDSHKSKKIFVTLFPRERKQQIDRPMSFEEGTGVLQVFESKNIEVTKKVTFSLVICYDKDILSVIF